MDKAREFHSGQPLAMPSPYRPQISIRSDNSIRESKSCELLGGRSTGEAVADELAAASALLEADAVCVGSRARLHASESGASSSCSEDGARRDSAATITMSIESEPSQRWVMGLFDKPFDCTHHYLLLLQFLKICFNMRYLTVILKNCSLLLYF